jgi:hypothetical protein
LNLNFFFFVFSTKFFWIPESKKNLSSNKGKPFFKSQYLKHQKSNFLHLKNKLFFPLFKEQNFLDSGIQKKILS